ncbi:MAG: hypothetical protein WKF84_28085 [Pyrinomonadaceae bacterium]
MKRQTVIVIAITFFVTVVLATVSGWSSWANAQRKVKRNTTARQQTTDDISQSKEPDTRRDVFIAANRAPQAAAITNGTWINSEPLTLESLRGRVVLIDFWTFGCYNCRNTLPTLKHFDEQYGGDRGLTIVGVHAPESDYEKNIESVRRAGSRLGYSLPGCDRQ